MAYHKVLISGFIVGATFVAALHKARHIILVQIDGTVIFLIVLVVLVVRAEFTICLHA
jgi:hypothetical protein